MNNEGDSLYPVPQPLSHKGEETPPIRTGTRLKSTSTKPTYWGQSMESKAHWNYRVLIVDDEDGIHSDFKDMLNPNRRQRLTAKLAETLLDKAPDNKAFFLPKFELLHATSGEGARDIICAAKASNQPIAAAYMDVRMPPGIDGVEAIRRIRLTEKDIELVIMTAYSDKLLPEILRDMELLNKLLYIRKPFAPEEVQQITLSLVERWNVEQELAKKQQQVRMDHQNLEIKNQRLKTTIHSSDEIIGESQIMQQTFALMQHAAGSDITVLISGESGTGKELIARAIHANTPRKRGPFITVNCAAIPETLIESELFGHERGAFTGATTKRIGKFEHANGGTIFFDEIGDLQLVLQAKLLRVLQERQIQRVGGTADIPVDIRVLSATNQDLEAMVEAGNFRADLFYRIAAFPIVVAPLRDRREDIPLLANHLLKTYAEKMTKSIKAISADALRLLMGYDFPGNVRELENIIERAVLLETTELLQPSNLSPQVLSMIPCQPVLPCGSTEILPFEVVERKTLAHALKVMGNDVTKAAQALKIGRSTLYRKLNLYNLPTSE